MKLLTPKEVADRKQAETAKDIIRTKEVKETLESLTKDLNETEARFNVALANQRIRWVKEEEGYLERLSSLKKEIDVLEKQKKEACIPIEERERKSYDLLNAAESAFKESLEKGKKADERMNEVEQMADMLQKKLDDVYEKETELEEREKKVLVRELAVEDERKMISHLSAELSTKLQKL